MKITRCRVAVVLIFALIVLVRATQDNYSRMGRRYRATEYNGARYKSQGDNYE